MLPAPIPPKGNAIMASWRPENCRGYEKPGIYSAVPADFSGARPASASIPEAGLGLVPAASAAVLRKSRRPTIRSTLFSLAAFGCCEQRLQHLGQCLVRQLGELNVAEEHPVFGLFHCLPREHPSQGAERLHLQKFVVGERFERASEVRVSLRWIGLGALQKSFPVQHVEGPGIAIEQTDFLSVAVVGVLEQRQVLAGELPTRIGQVDRKS